MTAFFIPFRTSAKKTSLLMTTCMHDLEGSFYVCGDDDEVCIKSRKEEEKRERDFSLPRKA